MSCFAFGLFCALAYVQLISTLAATPAGTSRLNTNNVTPSISRNGTVSDDNDDYFPYLEWSDKFDWTLIKAFGSKDHNNVLISPISLKLALAMLYEGAGGTTEKEFQSALEFPAQRQALREKYTNIIYALQEGRGHYVLNIGTRVFLDASVEPKQPYAAKVKAVYQTDIEATNFSHPVDASNSINSWIDTVTNGRIRDLVKADDLQDTILLVANGIYFKGIWRQQFLKNRTHTGGFYISPNNVVQVKYMANTDRYYYAESKDLDSKILRLPYRGKHFSLFIVLPNTKGGLQNLIRKIDLPTMKKQLYIMDPVLVDVVIPKFKFDFSATFSKVLEELGLHQMFQNTASFPGIARGPNLLRKLFVSEVKQKAGIEVNEEGSTIYAATDIQLGNKFGVAEFMFNVTHPFLFFLEEQTTGSILFVGKVENPLQTESLALPVRFSEENNTSSAKPEAGADRKYF